MKRKVKVMLIKEARAIARQVGATIEVKKGEEGIKYSTEDYYLVRLGVCQIDSTGARVFPTISARTPHEAAEVAVIETGRHASAIRDLAKKVYVDSDLIFGASRT
jgi:D-serine deaminase-like pyridoxal phosphate-dependent protein